MMSTKTQRVARVSRSYNCRSTQPPSSSRSLDEVVEVGRLVALVAELLSRVPRALLLGELRLVLEPRCFAGILALEQERVRGAADEAEHDEAEDDAVAQVVVWLVLLAVDVGRREGTEVTEADLGGGCARKRDSRVSRRQRKTARDDSQPTALFACPLRLLDSQVTVRERIWSARYGQEYRDLRGRTGRGEAAVCARSNQVDAKVLDAVGSRRDCGTRPKEGVSLRSEWPAARIQRA